MKAAELLVKMLEINGVSVIFGLPGYNILDIYDYLKDSDDIRHVLVRYENAAAVMADVYGRLTGKPGICLITAGPGATNSVTGVAGAFAESSPMIHLSGQCSTTDKIQPFHGVDDWYFLEKIFRPITKWSVTVEDPRVIPETINRAFKLAISGRKGPVHISLPTDVLRAEVNGEIEIKSYEKPCETIDGSSINLVYETISSSEKPVIIVGRGVLRNHCWDLVIRLSNNIYSPIFHDREGRGAIPFNTSLNVGYVIGTAFGRGTHPAVAELFEESDLILTLGLSLGSRSSRFFEELSGNKNIIHVYQEDCEDRAMIKRNVIEVNTSNLTHFIEKLNVKVGGKARSEWSDLEDRISKIKEIVEGELEKFAEEVSKVKPIHPAFVCNCIRNVLEKDAIVTSDIGSHNSWMEVYFRPYAPNTFIMPGRYGSMGFSLPAGIAAKIVYPDRQVVSVTGDGGLLMTLSELSTFSELKLDLCVIVFNDAKYGMIWKIQQRYHDGKFIAVDTYPPSFAKCAESFGIRGVRVEEPSELQSTLEEAFSMKKPVLVEVLTDYRCDFYKYRL